MAPATGIPNPSASGPYIWGRADWPKMRWPKMRWEEGGIVAPLARTRHAQGRLLGRMEGLGFPARAEAGFHALTQEVLKSSEIEGEHLDAGQVRSSLARRLGMDIGALAPADRHVDGMVEMTLDATRNFAAALTAERLFAWPAALFPTGRSTRYELAAP